MNLISAGGCRCQTGRARLTYTKFAMTSNSTGALNALPRPHFGLPGINSFGQGVASIHVEWLAAGRFSIGIKGDLFDPRFRLT